LSVAGDFNGRVGVGLGKSLENTSAIAKSKNKAKKSLVSVYITENGSIPHEAMIKNGSAMIFIKPAPAGAGIIAGGSVRKVLEFAGYKNISVKIIGSSNPINNSNTLIKALTELRPIKKTQKVDKVNIEKVENE
jgi:small subunit ribosomal protein S5